MLRQLRNALLDPRAFVATAAPATGGWSTLGIAVLLAVSLATSESLALRRLAAPPDLAFGFLFGFVVYVVLILYEFLVCLWLPIRWRAGTQARPWLLAGLASLPVLLVTLLAFPLALALPVEANPFETSWFNYLRLTLILSGGLWGIAVLRTAIDALVPGRADATLATALFIGASANVLLSFLGTGLAILSVVLEGKAAA